MSAPRLTDEELLDTKALVELHGGQTAAAKATSVPLRTLQNRMREAARRGLLGFRPVLPGFRVSGTATTFDGDGKVTAQTIQQKPELGAPFVMPPGQVVKGVSALVDADGREIQKWIKTRTDLYPIDWHEVYRNAFAEYEGRAHPIPAPGHHDPDFLNLIPANDWHINLLTWRREVGRSWDLKIAEREIGTAIVSAISRARHAAVAVVLGGGDLMHNDDNTNRTAKSHNVLDADGRHQKGIEVAQRLMVLTIETALTCNDRVVVRALKGNHDEYSSVAVAHFLSAWYRNEPRVTVDLDASLFWFYRFGKVMLAATHGHAAKLEKLPAIMAARQPAMWGATLFRYGHGFHVHHRSKTETEDGGAVCESHQAPVPPDSWHYGEGYLSGQSVQVITYHREFGEWTRAREPILDAVNAALSREAA